MREQIAAQRLARRIRFKPFLGGTDPTYVECDALPAAHAGVGVLLDGAEQSALRLAVQILQAAQVQRTARRLIKCAGFYFAVALAAEQRDRRVLPKTRGNHDEKRLGSADAEGMQVARVRLASGSQFAGEQYRG